MCYKDAMDKNVGTNSERAEEDHDEEIVETIVGKKDGRATIKDATKLKRSELVELSSKELVRMLYLEVQKPHGVFLSTIGYFGRV